jgi:DNA polymerase bacteriophage-type
MAWSRRTLSVGTPVTILHRDIETFSTVNLTKTGPWRYAGDPTTGVWCVAYAVGEGEPQIWSPGVPIPAEFQIAATDLSWIVVAHNDAFESAIEERLLAPRYNWPLIPVERHRCTMAAALANALPGGLNKAAAALGLESRKDDAGRRLMLQMAKPRKPRAGEDSRGIYWNQDPERIRHLQEYCRRDVELERELFKRLPPLSDSEQVLWALDQRINRRGFPVDVGLAKAAYRIAHERRAAIDHEITELTGGRITSAHQVAKIETFLKEHGHHVQSVGKRSVSAVLAHKPDDDVARLLRLRQEAAKASASKLATLLDLANDDRLHDTLRFHGAATGRWSGSKFQPQNLSRSTPADINATIEAVHSGLARVAEIGPPLAVIGSLSRAMICAPPGRVLIGGDYSGIEARITAWLANEQWLLDVYRRYDAEGGLDSYCLTAARILGRPVTPAQDADRQVGKMTTLAFGFGGGAGAFNRIAPDAGFSDTEVEQFKRQWRSAHPAIVRYWGDLHRALLRATRTGLPVTFKNLSAEMRNGNLYLKLPSGREIVYPEARVEPGPYDSDQIIFKDSALGKWRDTRAWHGTFCENVVQATARDLLAAAMMRLESAGYRIVLHVHDEIVAEVDADFGNVEEFERIMTELPAWAEGLPIAAEASRRQRYAKGGKPSAAETAEAETLAEEDEENEEDKPSEAPSESTTDIIMAPPALAAAISNMAAAIRSGATSEQKPENDRGVHDDPFKHYASGEERTGRPCMRYVYTDEQGAPHHRKTRTDSKKFWQEKREGGRWIKGAPQVKYLYSICALLAASLDVPIWITEGEKDADSLIALGLLTLTNPGGAGKWNSDFTTEQTERWFKGRHAVYVLEDNDIPGQRHVEIVAHALQNLVTEIRIVTFRELPAAGDVTDWLALGHSKADLLARAAAEPKYEPDAIEIFTADALQAMEFTPINFIVPGLIAEGLTLFAGKPKIGKSWLLLHTAWAVAANAATLGGIKVEAGDVF